MASFKVRTNKESARSSSGIFLKLNCIEVRLLQYSCCQNKKLPADSVSETFV